MGATIAHSTVSDAGSLYIPSANLPLVTRLRVLSPVSNAHIAPWVPGLETWHHRLGHCNLQTIINMARGPNVEGMPANLATPPSVNHAFSDSR
jgi:hypothetical protein